MERTESEKQPAGKKLDSGSLLLIVYLGLIFFLVMLGGASAGHAAENEELARVKLDDVKGGELLMPTGNGDFMLLPSLAQDVEINIDGMAARVAVTQKFENPGEGWIEAKYVFPLPDESAVDAMTMIVGERRIIGKIKEKEAAQKIYQQEKSEGKKTSLLEQRRPNMFITSVANIGPHEQVQIKIEYQQKVQYQDDLFSLRFPMAITPRYMPKHREVEEPPVDAKVDFAESGWAVQTDASKEDKTSLVNLHLTLKSGFGLQQFTSLYHQVSTSQEDGTYHLVLADGAKPDRDFVVQWVPKPEVSPKAALFEEVIGEEKYLLLMLMPPRLDSRILPREVIYIIDTSGSMGGESIRQAREALLTSLASLKPAEQFNIIEFNDQARALFPSARPADTENINEAAAMVKGLEAGGGTEMMSALKLALEDQGSKERLRQIVFITDGAVDNEGELFAFIAEHLGQNRLFTVGIGSAPNGYFMSRAAMAGRGTHTYIGNISEVKNKMGLLFDKLAAPCSTDIALKAENGSKLEVFPNPIADLYLGEPLVVTIKTDNQAKAFTLSGRQLGKDWSYSVPVQQGSAKGGISKLWARAKIRNLMESAILGGSKEKVRGEITSTALKYGLVSKYTSLVAVEEKISRPKQEALKKGQVANTAPKGMTIPVPAANAMFAGGAKTATPKGLFLLLGVCLLAFSTTLLILAGKDGKA